MFEFYSKPWQGLYFSINFTWFLLFIISSSKFSDIVFPQGKKPHFLSLPCDPCFLNSCSNFSKVENFSPALAFLGGQNGLIVCGTEREGDRMCLNESLVELKGSDDKPHIVPSYTKLRSATNNKAATAGIRPGSYLREPFIETIERTFLSSDCCDFSASTSFNDKLSPARILSLISTHYAY